MKKKINKLITFSLFFSLCTIYSIGQNSKCVDFKYAPDWYATNICLPDDTAKTLVGPKGQLLYDFGGDKFFPFANGKGFKTTFHILADEKMKFKFQKLYSSKVPIVETYATYDDLEIKQESFAYSSFDLYKYNCIENWKELKTASREDIIITEISNNTNALKTFNPIIVINSEYKVSENESIITINQDKHLFVSDKIKMVRQNLGKEKTLIHFNSISIPPKQKKIFVVIYDNGKKSLLTQQLKEDPEKTILKLKKIKTDVIDYWNNKSSVPYGHISIPDQNIQNLIDASLRNIWQAREIFNSKYSFEVGPTCYRGLWIVDGSFILETSAMVDKGKDARDGIEYMLSFQQPNGKFGKLAPDFWKENGIVLWTCVRHAMLTQDKMWLESIWPKLKKTVNYIKELRKTTLENDIKLDDGLIPPGGIDGGLSGEKNKAEYTNIYWNLLGLKSIIQAANWIGQKEDAKNWQIEYNDFYKTFQNAAHRDMVFDTYGNKYLPIPMDTKFHDLPQRAQWAFCHGVYPGQLFDTNDPIAKGTLNMLHTTLQEGMVMGTGWIIDGIWNYFASFYGHACLWVGESERAIQSLYAFANHASPLYTWREEHNPRDLHSRFVGDMPHNWASAEFVRLAVHLLAIDRGNELHLFEGLPKEWVKPGMETSLNNICTPFGKLTFNLKINSSGKSAILKIQPLSDSQCHKIIIHKKTWVNKEKEGIIELDPSKTHTIKINIK